MVVGKRRRRHGWTEHDIELPKDDVPAVSQTRPHMIRENPVTMAEYSGAPPSDPCPIDMRGNGGDSRLYPVVHLGWPVSRNQGHEEPCVGNCRSLQIGEQRAIVGY